MLETYATVLTNSWRNLYQNAKSSPILYLWFSAMMFLSIVMMVGLSTFLIWAEFTVEFKDIFVMIFFLFFMKSSADFHKYFVNSSEVTYALSTQASHKRTVFEIFLVIFWIELGLWALFSSTYSFLMFISGNPLPFPVEYIQLTLGVILASVLGACISLHFFSPKRIRLLPAGGILAVLWFAEDVWVILFLIVLSVLYLWWSLHFVMDSFQFVQKKNRFRERFDIMLDTPLKVIFQKETVVLWRDRLFFSFIFSAVATGIFTGYLSVYGAELLLPESLRKTAESMMPTMYVVLGIYVVTILTAVFPSLSFFLNEEKTIWILRHVPVSDRVFVVGKLCALGLPFLCCLPFIAYYTAFAGMTFFVFSIWLLIFSFLAGVILAFPLGAKYFGRKSDLLVLYCISLLLFVIVGAGVAFENMIPKGSYLLWWFYACSILLELGVLYISVIITSRILSSSFTQ